MTSRFNLDEYEPVEDRLRRFYNDYKDGRVITEVVQQTDDHITIKASLYRNFEDEKVWATGIAEEVRGRGGPVNATSHVENCETSAIGRALANANYAGKKRPSREEMAKVNRVAEAAQKRADSIRAKETLSGDNKVRDSMGRRYCVVCGKVVGKAVEKYSLDKFGKALCMEHQKNEQTNN